MMAFSLLILRQDFKQPKLFFKSKKRIIKILNRRKKLKYKMKKFIIQNKKKHKLFLKNYFKVKN